MPTVNPRVNVTLPPSLDALVARMAQHTRTSKSQVLRELLEAAEPALQRAVALMDAASKAVPGVLSGLAVSLEKAQGDAEQVASQLLTQLDTMQSDMVREAESIRGRRPSRPAAKRSAPSADAPNPPSSNRGVKSSGQGSSRVRKGRSA